MNGPLPNVPYCVAIIECCQECGGDGGHAVPVDINRFHGGLIERWDRCCACDGTGEIELETVPVTLDDHLEHPEGLPS